MTQVLPRVLGLARSPSRAAAVSGALAFVGLLLIALVAPASARAQTSPASDPSSVARPRVRPEVMTRVEQALMAIDSTVPASFWAGLGTEGLAALALVVDDAARPLGLRRRAVAALRHYHEPAARALLMAVARSVAFDEIMSRYAVGALADGYGLAALEELIAALADARALVREGAVLALARLRDPHDPILDARVRDALSAARAVERERFVAASIEAALR